MTTKSIFYSWQSDLPKKNNNYLIKEALRAAVKKTNKHLQIQETDQKLLAVDHDTKGIPGTPSIYSTIIEKIEECSLMVCDITPITQTKNGKHCANPNVMIEYGFATGRIGDRRLILVVNEAYGEVHDVIPFDLRHKRFPITFNLPSDASKEVRKKELKALTERFTIAINAAIDYGLFKDSQPTPNIKIESCFLADQDSIGISNEHSEPKELWWNYQPHYYIRTVPLSPVSDMTIGETLKRLTKPQLDSLGRWSTGSFYRDRHGSSIGYFNLSNQKAAKKMKTYARGLIKLFKDYSIWFLSRKRCNLRGV